MDRTLDRVKSAVGAGEYVLSVHAVERLRERRIMEWQVAVWGRRGPIT